MTIEMARMQVLAPAKINLSLKILGRRDDSFHELDTLIAPISLYDEIRIEKLRVGKGIEFQCDDPSVPQGHDNLAVRAANAFFERTRSEPAISIELTKNIPHGAGLGGGSSDAASVFRSEIVAASTCGNSRANRVRRSIFSLSVSSPVPGTW
jgi:4-diphosphocytidyl-2-C-methyl-D-erythritol kinase